MDVRGAVLRLLAARASKATVCPSEVARALGSGDNWRAFMPLVHAAVDELATEGLVELSWKGERLQERTGPYRIGRGEAAIKMSNDIDADVASSNKS